MSNSFARRLRLMSDPFAPDPERPDAEDTISLSDGDRQARVAALGMMHLAASQRLLEAHGHAEHGANLGAALKVLVDIMAGEIGRDRLSQAIDWASNEMWNCAPAGAGIRRRN